MKGLLRWRILVFVAIASVLGGARWLGEGSGRSAGDASLLDGLGIEGATEVAMAPRESEALGVDAYRYFELREGITPPVWVYAGLYFGLGGDAQIHAPEHCYPGSGYEIQEQRTRGEVAELVVRNGTDRRLVWYQYRTARGGSTAAWQLKRDMLLTRLFRQPGDGLLLRVSTPIGPAETVDEARLRIESVWREHAQPALDHFSSRG